MPEIAGLLLCIALGAASQAAADSQTGQAEPRITALPVTPPDDASLARLRAEISDADAEQIFALDLVFDQPVSVQALHETALQLQIPRVLAHVEYGPTFEDGPRDYLVLGLGEMYSDTTARQHTRCRALISAAYGNKNELRERPIEEWSVSKIHVYATAHAVRELAAGSLLPAAGVVDGSSAATEDIGKLAAYTRDEVAARIQIPTNVPVPEQCGRYVAPVDAPVLTSDYDPSLNELQPLADEDFRGYAFRVLSGLPTDSAVTIQLKFNFAADVDSLAALVWQFQIEGMNAEMVPERTDRQVMAFAELSIHGDPLPAQVERIKCQMRLGTGPQTTSQWYSDWVSVSLPFEKAWTFLSYPHLAQARIVGRFALGDLERLDTYYQRRSEKVYEMPPSIEIPAGCGDYYVQSD